MRIITKFGLWLLTATIITLVALKSLFSRERMSHDNGLVCKARIKINDSLDIPPSDFFQPGREFPCRLRHASVSFADDARLVVRSASLKFSDTDHDSPLDIMMNTGTAGPFSHAWHFLKFMIATIRGREQHIKPYLDKYPQIAKGITESICYPETFALLNYHSKTAMSYRDANGKSWYIKFKMAPWDKGPDRGRPTETELEQYWLQAPKEGETRSRNFLKDEYRRRISNSNVKYHLQAAFHDVGEVEDREMLNCAVAWDEDTHPWLDLAVVEVNEVMPTEEGNITWYDVCNHPPCMGIPVAYSIFDPASINYLREKDSWAKKARMQGYKRWGQLPPLVDDRNTLRSVLPPICLPIDEPEVSQEMRADELVSKRDTYLYSADDGMPPHVRHLPVAEKFTKAKSQRMLKIYLFGFVNALISYFELITKKRETLDVFDRYYPFWQEPPVSKRFASDFEFGRQRLNGVNPVLIKRCEKIPEKFPVTDEIVEGLLDAGDSLDATAKAGRLYILDHEDISLAQANIPIKNGYLATPISLFYCNNRGQLLPIAIQLEQAPGPNVPIFTPKDPYWLWTTVKTYVQSADAAYHELSSHLLRTHFVMETFAIASQRHLHERHPMHQLLKPHFYATMAINHSARTMMLAPGGPIDKTISVGSEGGLELVKREYQKWDFSLCDFPSEIANRGVDDKQALPSYWYRDDGLLLWEAISQYVSSVVDFWYTSDAELTADVEIQSWIAELASPESGKVKGLPEGGELNDRENLKTVMTRIIFTCTAEHSSVNNGQYAMFGYPPNVPGAMYKPWPTSKKDPLSERDFVSRLPNHKQCEDQMQMVYLLSQPTRWMVGDFEEPHFHGIPEMWQHIRDFRADLARISDIIDERNLGLEYPYPYLHPRQISESIAI